MKRNKNDHIIATFVCLGTINDKEIWIMLTINIIFDVFIEHIIILFSHLARTVSSKKDLITPLRRFYFNSHTLNVLNYTYIFCSISRKEGFLRQQAAASCENHLIVYRRLNSLSICKPLVLVTNISIYIYIVIENTSMYSLQWLGITLHSN